MPPIGNGVRLISNPGITRGAILATTVRSGFGRSSHLLGFYSGDATVVAGASIANTAACPNGYEPPYAWQMAPKGGGLATYNTIESENTLAGAMAMGINIEATMTAPGEVAGNLGLSVSMAVTMICEHTLSPGLSMVAELAASLASEGQIVASLSALAWLTAQLTNHGGLDSSNLRGTLAMSAEMTSEGDAVTAGACAAAVWNSVAASFNAAGTMGEVLNAAGGGSTPSQVAAAVWDALRATSVDAGSMGQALVELFELMGLDPAKPLIVTPTTRDAGAGIEQTIATVGTTTTVTRT